jgi:hypothetical protein
MPPKTGSLPNGGINMTDSTASEKCFKLIWTSQNEIVTIERGEYASIPEASADRAAALARLNAEYPASVDFHYPHDIKAGHWRVVPVEPIRLEAGN